MKNVELKKALENAMQAARDVGVLLKKNLDKPKKINATPNTTSNWTWTSGPSVSLSGF